MIDQQKKAERTAHKITTWQSSHEQSRTVSQRVADSISTAAGSWPFFFIHVLWFGAWIILEVEPFPYGLLTMIVSLEAIFLSTFILISEKRQSERDHLQALSDYETNLAAKVEIEQLMKRLDSIEVDKLDKILALVEKK